MPRLPVVSGPELVRALTRAGFVLDRQSGSHAVLFDPITSNFVSVPMHGGRDLPVGTVRSILRDARLTVARFRELL